MIGILLVTHGTLGESLIQCACHVLNKRPVLVAQIGVCAQDGPLDMLPHIKRLLATIDEGDGVIILTDIYGATPSNIAMKLLEPGRVEAISGANVPMLLRVLTYRDKEDIQTVITKAIAGACEGVLHLKGGT